MFQETMTQALSYADVLNYQTVNNAAVTSLGIDMSKFKRALFIINLWNTVAGTGTLNARLQGSANSNFTGNTNLTGTNITALTANNTATTVEIRADQLTQINSTYRYVRLSLTGATNAITISMIGLGGESVQSPASQYNLNTTYLTAGTVASN